MVTREQVDGISALVVSGGPNWEDMALNFRGKWQELTFEAFPLPAISTFDRPILVKGNIHSWGHLVDPPPWSSPNMQWLWIDLAKGAYIADRLKFDLMVSDFMYCVGPQSKDRWGSAIKAGKRPHDIADQFVANIRKRDFFNLNGSDIVNGSRLILVKGACGAMWIISESEYKSKMKRDSEPVWEGLTISNNNFLDTWVKVDFSSWTISWKNESSGETKEKPVHRMGFTLDQITNQMYWLAHELFKREISNKEIHQALEKRSFSKMPTPK
jgi:hypothetical protein